jgi:hypothetical protein
VGFIREYMEKPVDYVQELTRLIKRYNELSGSYLFIYNVSNENIDLDTQLNQNDYYAIREVLSDKKISEKNIRKIDFYIETLGGKAEAVADIVEFLRSHFDEVNFVVTGEAKSAGTILVLSGDNILMTETGSLGTIDAQLEIRGSWIPTSSYMDYVLDKREEAKKHKLNRFDDKIISQISPGELCLVHHAQNFSSELICNWLPKYKFKKLKLTDEKKRKKAVEVVRILTDYSIWKTHKRSIKIKDLIKTVGLDVINLDTEVPKLTEVVYRIQALCLLWFGAYNQNIYKIFAAEDAIVFRNKPKPFFIPLHPPQPSPPSV